MMTNMLRPFDNMMDTLWNEMVSWSHLSEIPTNVKEDDGGYTIELAVPGMERMMVLCSVFASVKVIVSTGLVSTTIPISVASVV